MYACEGKGVCVGGGHVDVNNRGVNQSHVGSVGEKYCGCGLGRGKACL